MKLKAILNPSIFRDLVTVPVAQNIKDVIFDLKAVIIQSFGLKKHGKFYRRPKIAGGGVYQASARGEAPAIRSGNLLRNLKTSFPKPLVGELLIDTKYARILEEELDRPYYTPAVENVANRFNNNILGRF